MTYPESLEILPVENPPTVSICVPGSKSITNRALVLAALASRQGPCELSNVLWSDDTEVMVDCLWKLGFRIYPDWPFWKIFVDQHAGELIPGAAAELFVANSGTTMRFLTALVSLGNGEYRLDGVPRMRQRPIGDLLNALIQLGVEAVCENGNECPPVRIKARGLSGGRVMVRGNVSSQFLSGLLMAAPFATGPVEIELDGPLVSEPYVEMTIRQMEDWGLKIESVPGRVYRTSPQTPKQPDGYEVEIDASAASYFFAAAAIIGSTVTVAGYMPPRDGYLPPRISLQGDFAFLDLLEQMGCRVERDLVWNTVQGGPLHGIDVDMNAISDTVMTLAAVACFAEGPTTIRNVAHIRHKETDRLAALATELRKVGAEVDEFPDGLRITPRSLHGAEIETYNDHRMAMSMALIGLRVPGIVIKNPGCVAKTYPGFWQDFEKLH